MWSRKPTPVRRSPSPMPSSSSWQADVRLLRLAGDLGGAAHGRAFSRSRIDCAWTTKPSASGDRHAGLRQRGRGVADPHLAHPPAEVPRAQPGGEARRAAGRQAVVRTGDVVAEGRRPRTRRRTRSRRCARAARAPRPRRPISSRCSGANAFASSSPASMSGSSTSAHDRVTGIELDRIQEVRIVARGHHDRPWPMLRLCGQIERRNSRDSPPSCEHQHVGRAGEAVDADVGRALALGLLHVEVARAGDDVDALDRLGAVRERGDRVRAAHRVDLVHAAQRARRQDDRVRARRADDDLLHARRLRGHDAHHDRRRIRRAPARHVDRRPPHRQLAHEHRVALRQLAPARSP